MSIEIGNFSLGEIDTKYHICPEIKFIDYNQSKEIYEVETEKIEIDEEGEGEE